MFPRRKRRLHDGQDVLLKAKDHHRPTPADREQPCTSRAGMLFQKRAGEDMDRRAQR